MPLTSQCDSRWLNKPLQDTAPKHVPSDLCRQCMHGAVLVHVLCGTACGSVRDK